MRPAMSARRCSKSITIADIGHQLFQADGKILRKDDFPATYPVLYHQYRLGKHGGIENSHTKTFCLRREGDKSTL